MGFNYLKRYYLEDHKLAQRARLEFYRALSTGRMIAFTGSMATQAFGYGGWQQLRMTLSGLATKAVQDLQREAATAAAKNKLDLIMQLIRDFEKRSASNQWAVPVGLSLVEEALESWGGVLPATWEPWSIDNLPGADRASKPERQWPLDRYRTIREGTRVGLARRFRQPIPHWRIDRDGRKTHNFDLDYNVPRALWRNLGIRRFATPSYDFELERATMLTDSIADDRNTSPFDKLRTLRANPKENFSWDFGSGRIRRVFDDGWAIESDVLNRERIDRMIEFAVGTDDVDAHILHVHGRACNWRTMIASQSDYDNLYRRNDLNRSPFEFTKRLMMGGNPILFVGLGMSESDLNTEMQEFISNNPYQRVAPTFLVWSAGAGGLNPEGVAAMRIDFLRRLGVLTLFDTDFLPTPSDAKAAVSASVRYKTANDRFQAAPDMATLDGTTLFDDADNYNASDLSDLRNSLDLLAEGLAPDANPFVNPSLREQQIGDTWRSMGGRVAAKGNDEPVVLWSLTDRNGRDPNQCPSWLPNLISLVRKHPLLCVIGPQGCGKGSAAQALARVPPGDLGLTASNHCLVVNGGFSFDTDTVLDGVSRFLTAVLGGRPADEPPRRGRSRLFSELNVSENASSNSTQALVIMNGMERFFDLAGLPLSAELDELLGMATGRINKQTPARNPKVRWVLFGTERVRKYMSQIGVHIVEFSDVTGQPANSATKSDGGEYISIPGNYLNAVWQQAKDNIIRRHEMNAAIDKYHANGVGRISGDSQHLRQTLFGTLFDGEALSVVLRAKENGADITTARAILKSLAFIGLPVEKAVLRLLPSLADLDKLESFERTFEALVQATLVLELDGYRVPNKPREEGPKRYSLHRMLLTELRYRYGIPLSEAKLSTAFNMSLYVAQPIDSDIPDTDIHDQLGEAIDRLIGSYKTPASDPNFFREIETIYHINAGDYASILEEVGRRCGSSKPATTDAERQQLHRLCSDLHGQALRAALALVRGYYSTTGLLTLDSGDRLIQQGRDGVLLEHAERLDDLIDAYGKRLMARKALRDELWKRANHVTFLEFAGAVEPFYADELVWLHNERGVVRLAMGDLYEAKRSFDQAMKVNRACVEFEDRAHNWRRIRLNQLTVDIEMGDIGLGERKCDELISVSCNETNKNKVVPLREDKLATAIANGYKGWCLHLRGQAEPALKLYTQTVQELSDLGEIRAQAYFERLRANAMARGSSPNERRKTLERARDLAQSAMQMDIVHRLQIALADTYLFDPDPIQPELRAYAHRYLEEALSYALNTNVHRVRCEASMTTARVRLSMSDFEGALRFATDAMMVATRYGLELRKISLRAQIAKIMAARGHPVTAENLARTCIKMATRTRYQTAIDEASEVIISIPRISSAISNSDQSGLRNF